MCLHRKQSIFMSFHIVDCLQAIVKNCFAQDAAVFSQVLVFYGEFVGFNIE